MRKNYSRFKYMIIVGIGISLVLDLLISHLNPNNALKHEGLVRILDFLTSIIITAILWEGNLRIDHWMNSHFPWERKPLKRVFIHLPVCLIFSSFVIHTAMVAFNKFVCELPDSTKESFKAIAIVIGLMVSIILLTVEICIQFFYRWKNSLIEIEKYKTESAQAQLQNLKNQINPHFLFNNMSVLSSLVYKDQDKAVDFINQLSKVYRYLLDNKDSELVSLEEELIFIRSYNYLLQIRFDTNIKFEMDIEENASKQLLPPMALQILIENVIKHNEVSSEFPLTVKIKANRETLEVINNLQLRLNKEPSSKTGLKNIRERYQYFTDRQIEIIEDLKTYIVKIPLLNSK